MAQKDRGPACVLSQGRSAHGASMACTQYRTTSGRSWRRSRGNNEEVSSAVARNKRANQGGTGLAKRGRHRGKWTLDEECELRRLRSLEHKTWADIAIAMSRSDVSCRRHYDRITTPNERFEFRSPKKWTLQAEEDLVRMRFIDGKTTKEIAEIMGRTISGIQARLEFIDARKARGKPFVPAHRLIPEPLIVDRDRRALAPRPLTSWLCGDPAPGQSALDKKQQVTA